MYESFYGLKEAPFSIAPDPRYLYMSERHREALAHLLFSLQREEGGFVLLTGEVGTGKTTICRSFLERVPERTDVAFIVHPRLTARELLATICDELGIRYPAAATIKILVDQLNHHLLDRHANGRHTAIIIDEAQNLSIDVLEQLRLLTNLETSTKKLLQIILLGQPELREILQRDELRQLSQRITARYHLEALSLNELHAYLKYRLAVAGTRDVIFTDPAVKALFRLTKGIPRLINLICDRAMLGAYSASQKPIGPEYIRSAAREIGLFNRKQSNKGSLFQRWWMQGAVLGIAAGLFVLSLLLFRELPDPGVVSGSRSIPEIVAPTKTTGQTPDLLRAGGLQDTAAGVSESAAPASKATDSSADTVTETESAAEARESEQDAAEASALKRREALLATARERISKYQPDKNNKLDAYLALMAAWRVDDDLPRSGLVCDYIARYGLSCLHREGSWSSLLRLNRPAVLRLRNSAGEAFFITLVAVEESRGLISVVLDNEVIDLPQNSLDDYWDGDYSIAWKQPPYLAQSRGSKGYEAESAWLKRNLDLAFTAEAGELDADAFKKLDLAAKITWFQRKAGILADGVAGAITLIMLNNWTGSDAPRLVYDSSIN